MRESVKISGHVKGVIEYDCGKVEVIEFPNTILVKGRQALASCLANEIGDSFNFFVNRMIFGDGGTAAGSTKFVNASRNGLFGITRAAKPVIASIDPDVQSQVLFVSVLSNSDAVGYVLNEMALQLATGDLYSMVTFPDLTKTSQMQITWSWGINML